MLSVRKVRLSFGGAPLLDGVSFELGGEERACLVGRNGTGKSSLLRIAAGVEPPDGGEVQLVSGHRLAYLPQEVPADLVGTVAEVVASGFPTDHLEEWTHDHRLERLLAETELEAEAPVTSLSAGLKRRVLLARCLAAEPDLLILDEPTNHLDVTAIAWMEQFLRERFQGGLLFVSHDRAFLASIANRILDLDRGQLTSWDGSYENYRRRKAEWLDAEAHREAEFDKKLAEEERWIRRGIQARRTRNEGRVRALQKLRETHRERRTRQGEVRLSISTADRSGAKVIEAENVSFAYGDTPIIRDLSTVIERGDRVGIVGPNGTGKTTLLRLLLGELTPQSGTVKHGTRLEVAYFDQLRNQLDEDLTVAQTISDDREFIEINGQRQHVMSYLRDFLFPPDRARSTVSMLSGGERNRLLLARLFTKAANVLVLDEPTNDLDLETLELLEEQLTEFKGTVLLVSHDRAFLDAVVTELLVLDGSGGVHSCVGGYTDFLASQAAAKKAASSPAKVPAAGKRPSKPARFLNRERWELEALPGEIEVLEAEQAALAKELADPEMYARDPKRPIAIQERLDAIEADLLVKYERWEALEQKRSEIEDAAG